MTHKKRGVLTTAEMNSQNLANSTSSLQVKLSNACLYSMHDSKYFFRGKSRIVEPSCRKVQIHGLPLQNHPAEKRANDVRLSLQRTNLLTSANPPAVYLRCSVSSDGHWLRVCAPSKAKRSPALECSRGSPSQDGEVAAEQRPCQLLEQSTRPTELSSIPPPQLNNLTQLPVELISVLRRQINPLQGWIQPGIYRLSDTVAKLRKLGWSVETERRRSSRILGRGMIALYRLDLSRCRQ